MIVRIIDTAVQKQAHVKEISYQFTAELYQFASKLAPHVVKSPKHLQSLLPYIVNEDFRKCPYLNQEIDENGTTLGHELHARLIELIDKERWYYKPVEVIERKVEVC